MMKLFDFAFQFYPSTVSSKLQGHVKPVVTIRITCPCDLYPLTPHFYTVKLGFTGYAFFLIFAQNTDCGYTLEPPVLTSTHNLCFRAKIRKTSQFFI